MIIYQEILFSWREFWLELSKDLGPERKKEGLPVFGEITGQCYIPLFLSLGYAFSYGCSTWFICDLEVHTRYNCEDWQKCVSSPVLPSSLA